MLGKVFHCAEEPPFVRGEVAEVAHVELHDVILSVVRGG